MLNSSPLIIILILFSHKIQVAKFLFYFGLHLDFRYKKGSDSVLVVTKEDYDPCNVNNPVQKMDNGDSTFQFNNPGPYFFISGNAENCKKGQKMIVLVMSVRQNLPKPPNLAAPPSESGIPPQQFDASSLIPSAQSPLKASGSTRVGVGVGVILIFASFAGWFSLFVIN